MFKKGFLLDVLLFVAIVLILLVVLPMISEILGKLIRLQLLIAIVGGLVLWFLVRRMRRKG